VGGFNSSLTSLIFFFFLLLMIQFCFSVSLGVVDDISLPDEYLFLPDDNDDDDEDDANDLLLPPTATIFVTTL
jgi:hypothetical protein